MFAAQIAEVLERVQELRQQLQSFVRHQQALREGTRGEHSEMVQEASTTVVQQRVAFLTRMKVRSKHIAWPFSCVVFLIDRCVVPRCRKS